MAYRFVVLFLEIAFALLALAWLTGAVFGSHGGLLLGGVSQGWRRWWWRTFPRLTLIVLTLAAVFAVAIRYGFEPAF